MNKILTALCVLGVICLCITAVRWYVLTHIKLGLETEFYSTAIKFMKENGCKGE